MDGTVVNDVVAQSEYSPKPYSYLVNIYLEKINTFCKYLFIYYHLKKMESGSCYQSLVDWWSMLVI